MRSLIEQSHIIKGSKDPNGTYDGAMGNQDAPVSVYFGISPASDGLFFPMCRFPKRLKGGDPTSILTLNMAFLSGDGYRLFWVATTMTQYGRMYSSRAQTHVVFVRDGSREFLFCLKYFVELEKRKNQILFINDANGRFYRFGTFCTAGRHAFVLLSPHIDIATLEKI